MDAAAALTFIVAYRHEYVPSHEIFPVISSVVSTVKSGYCMCIWEHMCKDGQKVFVLTHVCTRIVSTAQYIKIARRDNCH